MNVTLRIGPRRDEWSFPDKPLTAIVPLDGTIDYITLNDDSLLLVAFENVRWSIAGGSVLVLRKEPDA